MNEKQVFIEDCIDVYVHQKNPYTNHTELYKMVDILINSDLEFTKDCIIMSIDLMLDYGMMGKFYLDFKSCIDFVEEFLNETDEDIVIIKNNYVNQYFKGYYESKKWNRFI